MKKIQIIISLIFTLIFSMFLNHNLFSQATSGNNANSATAGEQLRNNGGRRRLHGLLHRLPRGPERRPAVQVRDLLGIPRVGPERKIRLPRRPRIEAVELLLGVVHIPILP